MTEGEEVPLREAFSAPGTALAALGWIVRAASKALASDRAMLQSAHVVENMEHLYQQLQNADTPLNLPCVVAVQDAMAATDRPASTSHIDSQIVWAHQTHGVECVDSASNGFYTSVVRGSMLHCQPFIA